LRLSADISSDGEDAMIKLTRLNGNPMMINSDLIKTAEASPDTMLTLINGEKLIVREELDQVMELVLRYRARLLAGVARYLPAYDDLRRVAAVSGADRSASSNDASATLQFPLNE
jgi:flagellar protein FlbD